MTIEYAWIVMSRQVLKKTQEAMRLHSIGPMKGLYVLEALDALGVDSGTSDKFRVEEEKALPK